MPAPVATAETATPATCQVRDWVIFGPGRWKDDLYVPARCRQIVANFDRLSHEMGHTVPRVALGHDQQQRFAKSLGFPNVGTISGCRLVPGYEDQGYFAIDLDGVPTEVGGEISAGRLPGGSVELKSGIADPQDPAQRVPGDVLTGVAILGEEQPCVRSFPPDLQERSRPKATFANGSPVPPNTSPTRWLSAMADVTRAMAAEYRGEYVPDRRAVRINGREFSDTTVCFSDFDPQPGPTMTPEQEAALAAAGFTPEQLAAMKAALPASAPAVPAVPETNPTMSAGKKPFADVPPDPNDPDAMMSACMKKYSEDPNATPEQKMFAAMHKKFSALEKSYSEDKKRIGELQASAESAQKKDEEAKAAEMSDRVDKAVGPLYKKVAPVVIEKVHKPALMGLLASKQFSAEADRVKAFNDYLAPILALDDNKHLATVPGPVVTNDYVQDPLLRRMAGPGSFLDRNTNIAKKVGLAG